MSITYYIYTYVYVYIYIYSYYVRSRLMYIPLTHLRQPNLPRLALHEGLHQACRVLVQQPAQPDRSRISPGQQRRAAQDLHLRTWDPGNMGIKRLMFARNITKLQKINNKNAMKMIKPKRNGS